MSVLYICVCEYKSLPALIPGTPWSCGMVGLAPVLQIKPAMAQVHPVFSGQHHSRSGSAFVYIRIIHAV